MVALLCTGTRLTAGYRYTTLKDTTPSGEREGQGGEEARRFPTPLLAPSIALLRHALRGHGLIAIRVLL